MHIRRSSLRRAPLLPGAALLILLFALIACDDVAPAHRWKADPAPVLPRRTVLLIDYTGQRCNNCPAAAELLRTLTAGAAGARILPVSVHGGALALSADRHPAGLATPDADALTRAARVGTWPAGAVDRLGAPLLRPAEWSATLADRLILPPDTAALAGLAGLRADYRPDDRALRYALPLVDLRTAARASAVPLRLHLWLVEDSIAAPQTLADGTESDTYVHRHVFRRALTPLAGFPLADLPAMPDEKTAARSKSVAGAPPAPTKILFSQSVTLPVGFGLSARFASSTRILPDRLSVVAFLTAESNGEVRAAAQCRVRSAKH